MGNPSRVLALRPLRYTSFCLIVIFLIIGWCRAAGENGSLSIEDPGSQDRVTRATHPKAPPLPTGEDIPPNTTLYRIVLEQGDWYVFIEDGASDSEVRDLLHHICEDAGERDPMKYLSLAAMLSASKRGYQRTSVWFEMSGALDIFDKYLASLAVSAAERPVNVLEVGSFEGASAVWIARHLLLHPDSMLICIDLWTGGPGFEVLGIDSAGSEDRFRSNMAKAPNNERVTAVKGDSLSSLSSLIAAGGTSTFDFIYVDGSHTMQHVLADAILSFRLLKVGGLLIFDDMKNFPGVTRATAAVMEALEGENCVEILHNEELMVARKTAEDPWITPASVVTMGKRADHPLLSTFAAQPSTTYAD